MAFPFLGLLINLFYRLLPLNASVRLPSKGNVTEEFLGTVKSEGTRAAGNDIKPILPL